MKATIYHNPRCSKSRETLALLQDAGADVTVIEYLKTPPSRAELARLYAKAGMSPRQGLRTAEEGAKGLKDATNPLLRVATPIERDDCLSTRLVVLDFN